MPHKATVEEIEKEIEGLTRADRLKLLDRLSRNLGSPETAGRSSRKRDTLYGMGKGLWDEDAQEYVDRLREDRT
ncbi:MAG: hypothetical protein HZA22_00415 [Nitrospirae bacterium]|nr:hypothetical protein [Nitrospirota bacterium]MBI5695497.1 hypothetical protein [Nitrospirota bacterium]